MLTCWMRGLFIFSSRTKDRGQRTKSRWAVLCSLFFVLHTLSKLTVCYLYIDLAQLGQGFDQVRGVACERCLALLGGGAQRVADHAGLGELVVVHWELEVLVAIELHVGRAVGLAE